MRIDHFITPRSSAVQVRSLSVLITECLQFNIPLLWPVDQVQNNNSSPSNIERDLHSLSFRLRIVEILNFCNMVPLIYFASARTRAGHPNRHTHQRIRPRLLPANTTHFVFWLSQTGSLITMINLRSA